MAVPVRLGLFVAALAVLAGAAALLGRASGLEVDAAPAEEHAAADGAMPATGLSDVAAGLRFELTPSSVQPGKTTRLEVRLEDEDGAPVTELDEAHDEPPLHLILVRRDLSGYLHLHPRRAGDGFAVDATVPEPGLWRAYADFERDGEKVVLGRDLLVPGDVAPLPLDAPGDVVETDGYRVELEAGDLRAGEETELAFELTRAGERVVPEPYLGASGHLVAIREADLTYLHVHPVERGAASTVAFDAELAEPGRYALFLQFRDAGSVRTARFAVEVER